jgi:hypothetical protein
MQNRSEANPRWVLSTIRQKNIDTISELGLSLQDVENEILSLSVDDFCEGPLKDRLVPGDLWVFGKTIQGKEIYIKLKLSGGDHCVTVLSFHTAEAPLKYLFKNQLRRQK